MLFRSSFPSPYTTDLTLLLEAGRRLATVLPSLIQFRSVYWMERSAATGVARTQVRWCLATLRQAASEDLASLRARLSKSIVAIRSASDEPTARALYQSRGVQDALWTWASIEASMFARRLTRSIPFDPDKLDDMVGDSVYNFMRETPARDGQSKLTPFVMMRTWDVARMPDPIGTLRAYLAKWVQGVVQGAIRQQANEGVSLDTEPDGAEPGHGLHETLQDNQATGPETLALTHDDPRSQATTLIATYQRQKLSLEDDIRAFDGRKDAYSTNQRTILQNRLSAIEEMVGPLLDRLKHTADLLVSKQTDRTLTPYDRERQVTDLKTRFESTLNDLDAISSAQERAFSVRSDATRTEARGSEKKLFADPLTTAQAYARARENADLLLPNVFSVLTHRKSTDLHRRYPASLVSLSRALDGITSQADLASAISRDDRIRSTANDRALFTATALRTILALRDMYAFDEKHSVSRGEDEYVPKSAAKRFAIFMDQTIERDAVLRSRSPQMLALLKEFLESQGGFRAMWDNADYLTRAAAYEWARNEKVNKRWSDLSQEEVETIADAANERLYAPGYRPLAARSLADLQNRVTRDLDLTQEQRTQIMRDEVDRIKKMLRGDIPRASWAHGEPADSTRFHDRLRSRNNGANIEWQTKESPDSNLALPERDAASSCARRRIFASQYDSYTPKYL